MGGPGPPHQATAEALKLPRLRHYIRPMAATRRAVALLTARSACADPTGWAFHRRWLRPVLISS
jgi:hypothetical protein